MRQRDQNCLASAKRPSTRISHARCREVGAGIKSIAIGPRQGVSPASRRPVSLLGPVACWGKSGSRRHFETPIDELVDCAPHVPMPRDPAGDDSDRVRVPAQRSRIRRARPAPRPRITGGMGCGASRPTGSHGAVLPLSLRLFSSGPYLGTMSHRPPD